MSFDFQRLIDKLTIMNPQWSLLKYDTIIDDPQTLFLEIQILMNIFTKKQKISIIYIQTNTLIQIFKPTINTLTPPHIL